MPGFRRRLALRFAPLVACGLLVAATTAPVRAASPPADEAHVGTELVLRALSLLGVNYKWGGNSPDTGLDCSGLVRHVFSEATGLVLPRRAEDMSRNGDAVRRDQLRPGDLVFFNTLRRAFSHVGIYIGNGQFVHAPSSGGNVRVESLSGQYWRQRFNGARRVLAVNDASPARGAASFYSRQESIPAARPSGVAAEREQSAGAQTSQVAPPIGAPRFELPFGSPYVN
jgi:hypothetical protein